MTETVTDPLDYTGKSVLVVGGTSGIGNGIARRFRDHNATVHLWGTRSSPADYADEGTDLLGMKFSQVDVCDHRAVEAFIPEFDALDVLVLSQGAMFNLGEYEMDNFLRVLQVNVGSLASVSFRFKDMLAARGGSIVMISSMGSVLAVPSSPAYCASKHAVTGLCQSLAMAWAAEGVRVNAIGPGVFPSRLAKIITDNADYLNAVVSKNPMGRLGRLEEIGDAALFLASPMASYITGHTLMVDGGHTLNDIVNHNDPTPAVAT
ncbi:MAG TPA: SDR family oxidoreductase [Pseudonocardia sp.]|jgi:3-oxoacyl-[acyl-carrier protein] reductase